MLLADNGTVIHASSMCVTDRWIVFLHDPSAEEGAEESSSLCCQKWQIGDTVLTTSGFYGVIIDITDEDVIVEFGSNKNCRIPMQKAAIAQIEKPNAE